MVAFIVYDPAQAGTYKTVVEYGDCPADDIADQSLGLTAIAVPQDQIENFLNAASALESPPETGGDVSVNMLFEPPNGPIILTMGSSLSTEREVTAIRQQLLADSDWTQLLDAPLTATKQAQWATYRQALRDIPTQPGYPGSVTWPVKPT